MERHRDLLGPFFASIISQFGLSTFRVLFSAPTLVQGFGSLEPSANTNTMTNVYFIIAIEYIELRYKLENTSK